MLNTKNVALCLFVGLTAIMSCTNKQKADYQEEQAATKKDNKFPILDFKDGAVVNLGTIKEGEKTSHTYSFVNTGTAPLKIDYCNASCGCTVPTWPKDPIPVGGKGEIKVEFNSKNKEGKMFKNVSIHANTDPEFTSIGFNIEVLKNK